MFDIAIIGGGLAGFSLIQHLLEAGIDGKTIALLDAGKLASGASGAPGAVLHPLPGRSLTPKDGYIESYRYGSQWLERLQARTPLHFLTKTPMLRPFMEWHFATRQMKRSYQRSRDQYEGAYEATEWEGQELKERYPLLAPVETAIEFTPSYVVQLPVLLQQLYNWQKRAGVEHRFELPVDSMCFGDGHWQLQTAPGRLQARQVILSPGYQLQQWFPQLNLSTTAGELLLVRPPDSLPALTHMASAGGHVAPLPDGQWVLGSTYYPGQETHDESDEQVTEALIEKTSRLFPALKEATPTKVWFGVRGVLPQNRQPVVGSLPGYPHLHVLSAFASKGLFWIPWLSSLLAAHLAKATDAPSFPPFVDAQRLDPAQWQGCPTRLPPPSRP